MREEKLELVTSFAQLRVGMKVVLKPAPCGCPVHAGMLLPGTDLPIEFQDGGVSVERNFVLEPTPGCAVMQHYKQLVVTAPSVSKRVVYRVVDERWDRKQRAQRALHDTYEKVGR